MNEKVIFCTSLIDNNRQRYQDWIDYYTAFFDKQGVDLFMINDGPFKEPLDWKGVQIRSFEQKLGRESVWIFPGWKRSFYHALIWLIPQYKWIGHIESDCWITPQGKHTFLYYLEKIGYFTGFTQTYNFPEAALQVINDPGVRQYFLDKYSCQENWREDIDFELDLKRLNPTYILDGERLEGNPSRYQERYTFLAGTTYSEFKRLHGSL